LAVSRRGSTHPLDEDLQVFCELLNSRRRLLPSLPDLLQQEAISGFNCAVEVLSHLVPEDEIGSVLCGVEALDSCWN
jgi:hypothetical protein